MNFEPEIHKKSSFTVFAIVLLALIYMQITDRNLSTVKSPLDSL